MCIRDSNYYLLSYNLLNHTLKQLKHPHDQQIIRPLCRFYEITENYGRYCKKKCYEVFSFIYLLFFVGVLNIFFKNRKKIFFCIHKIYEKFMYFFLFFLFNEYFILSLFLLSLKINRMYKLTGLFDDEDIRMAWNAFGLYISRQLRMGRGVIIPQFGVFSFSAPEVNLKGCTNPNIRDKQLRIPIFIVNKDFVKGLDLQSAIGTAVTIRPYAVYGSNGKIPVTKINFTEIGCYCSKSKDQTKIAVDRVIKQLSDETRTVYNKQAHVLSLIHISEPTRLGMISYAVFCLKKKKKQNNIN
eukprot:TRINITY_DN3217_c0_g1_i3.p1 TRINITY_DN3217_c0_g1~~TRINITY_DN3217_c0_g1_i3.p1  ORF type:complete len:298 (+),score=35.13 TRINITY_DN3217_c0_g1_i3:198-1091(+)